MLLVTGATGFLGKRVTRLLNLSGKSFIKSSLSLGVDFRDYQQTIDFFKKHKFTKVINCFSCRTTAFLQFVETTAGTALILILINFKIDAVGSGSMRIVWDKFGLYIY